MLWREFDNRANWGGTDAALITRADLVGGPRASLASALTLARPLLMKGLRLHPAALSNPGSAVYPCIFVNGRPMGASLLLDYFELGEIEAIEAYGPGTLQWDRLVGKFAASRPSHLCGAAVDRALMINALGAGQMAVPLGRSPDTRGMISVLVIWLRQ